MRARWLTIATVKLQHYVIIRGWGAPGGFYVHWFGRIVSSLAPCEFIRWRDILSIVDGRLRRHGLRRVDWGTVQSAQRDYLLLRVRVIRSAG
jgi:hypothetical protein